MVSRYKRKYPDRDYLRASAPVEERFFRRIQYEPNTGCWLWEGAPRRAEEGYGRIDVGGKAVPAHRYSYEYHRGPIPSGMVVCHKCDTPACVNPDHLFLGTQGDNVRDCAAKGRLVDNSGERSPLAKLTDAQVAEIRAMPKRWGDGREVAARYGISRDYLYQLRWGVYRKGIAHGA